MSFWLGRACEAGLHHWHKIDRTDDEQCCECGAWRSTLS